LKWKIAVGLATLAGALTVCLTYLNNLKQSIVFYRGIFTFVLFLAGGYLICILGELYLKKTLKNDGVKGGIIDVKNEPDENILPDLNIAESDKVPEFKPLNTDDLTNYPAAEK